MGGCDGAFSQVTGVRSRGLRLRPPAQLEYLVELAGRLIDVDGQVDLYEYCFYRVLRISLGQAVNPALSPGPRRSACWCRSSASTSPWRDSPCF